MNNIELDRIKTNISNQKPDNLKVTITLSTKSDSEKILEKAKEVMVCVSRYAYTNTWPADHEWRTILPDWFVKSMTTKSAEDRNNDPFLWHFESWVAAMKDRAWLWYSSFSEANTATVTLEIINAPILYDALLYLFYSLGINMNDITVKDDYYD